MFGLKKMEKEIDRLKSSLDDAVMIGEYYKKNYHMLQKRLDKIDNTQPTITLKDNNFPKAVLANLVATHGIDSNDCKNHQRDRDNVMSGIMSTISVGNKEFHLGNKLNKYVIAELIEAGYEIEYDDYGTIIRWGNAYLTPQS
jgi:hypothetical protein